MLREETDEVFLLFYEWYAAKEKRVLTRTLSWHGSKFNDAMQTKKERTDSWPRWIWSSRCVLGQTPAIKWWKLPRILRCLLSDRWSDENYFNCVLWRRTSLVSISSLTFTCKVVNYSNKQLLIDTSVFKVYTRKLQYIYSSHRRIALLFKLPQNYRNVSSENVHGSVLGGPSMCTIPSRPSNLVMVPATNTAKKMKAPNEAIRYSSSLESQEWKIW